MDCTFRKEIIERLKQRNEVCGQFETIFASKLIVFFCFELWRYYSESTGNEAELREELSRLYRKKEQNDQQLIETNNRLENLQKKFDELQLKYECAEGEISDVHWLPNGESFVAGGTDKKLRATLMGMNGSVMRIDFNVEARQVLAAGADFAIRIWGIDDLRHSFTGHSDKVATAKFHASGTKVVSGSHDRTIRIWDLSTRKCYKTLFPGSTVFDLVSNPQLGSMIISGHYDKRVRIWDITTDEPTLKVDLNGRVTSLAMSQLVLCSCRDDTLSLIDLRSGLVVQCYSAEQYRSSYDYARCCLSPDLEYCASGSVDGKIYIWNLRNCQLETVLGHNGHDHAVTSVAWHPRGHYLLSADRMKTICVWS
uniref:WD_REPEATS_REGION domain-containing protein n=1 Tax=Syphacia muris TaxID=451379 RepID=A0A0N5A9H6_9BILA